MIFLEWIPWALTGNLIVFASTFGTRIRINKLLILVPILLGIVSLYSWITVFSDLFMDLRVLFLFSYLIFSIGLAICVARDAPMSERYFLKVQGPVKEMEIALYKWFHVPTRSSQLASLSTVLCRCRGTMSRKWHRWWLISECSIISL